MQDAEDQLFHELYIMQVPSVKFSTNFVNTVKRWDVLLIFSYFVSYFAECRKRGLSGKANDTI